MANIKNFQMWNTICSDDRIGIRKSLFGMRTTAIYNPTNSVIDAKSFEYSPADGERLKRLLESPAEQLSERMGDFRPKATVNGNYMVEVCQSHDGAFLAVQLFQFISMSYEPVTEVLLFEGSAAGIVGQLF